MTNKEALTAAADFISTALEATSSSETSEYYQKVASRLNEMAERKKP